ncbi:MULTISPECIES: acyltransferase family protein [unclassified Janibacter]|uniref:acyltransferase family protein n=1 Tax=unclassified Janibacter TaxID=2649294 RepID=UPI003D054692
MSASSPEILADQSVRGQSGATQHMDALTGYRGVACLLVVLVHGAGYTAYPSVGIQGYGPIALFVLSGYLLIAPWSKWSLGQGRQPDLRTFARRRLARIFPPYLVLLAVVAIIYPASQPQGLWSWVRALTLTNWLRSDGLRPAMQHLWSMGTEFSWYVALPAIGALLGLLGRRVWPGRPLRPIIAVLLGATLTTIAWDVWLATGDHSLSEKLTYPMWLPAHLASFVVGATVRHVQIVASAGRSPRLAALASRWWLPAAGALVAFVVLLSPVVGAPGWTPLTPQERGIRTVADLALAAFLLVALLMGRGKNPLAQALSTRPMVAVGRWSYGIYLWHLPVTVIAANHLTIHPGPMGFVSWIAILGVISTALGAVSYRFVEVPAIDWSKRTKA